ncbi:S8 family peptidase [Vreelandella zhanjiangensis]|uniref:S8 family peptidase n=1 Tax=Vreelandella zhanjiangensis TaxID=1121960 RepID=UPI00402A6A9E
MSDRPLLWFPQPTPASRSNLSGRGGKINLPNHQKQGERVGIKLARLQRTFEARRAEILKSAEGLDPEQVLVIETVGTVEDFYKAIKKIDGFEWMGEIEVDEIPPDEYFSDIKTPEKLLKGRLYLVLTNQQALMELLSLWRQYQNQSDPKMKFDSGLTKFRDVFCHLHDIRKWGPQDRLRESGILDVWQEELDDPYFGGRAIRFEAELWYRASPDKRRESAATVIELIEQLGGRIISQCSLSGINYQAILAELPADKIQEIINTPETELVKCENIMFFRPVGQISAGDRPSEEFLEPAVSQDSPLPQGDPVLAILDGLPLANHELLQGRIIVDDPDGWTAEYSANERLHGTTMASLAVHGDLNENEACLSRPVYIRPIMKPDATDFRDPRRESLPTDQLSVDLVHRAIRRLFEYEGAERPAAPTVKIVSLSIGDPGRHFSQVMSPLARLLDWLSAKYGVLFIVSAGNQLDSVPLDITLDEFEDLTPEQVEAKSIGALLSSARSRTMLSPAESINGISVGSVHYDQSQNCVLANRFDPFTSLLPSPVSPFGSGYRRAIKPDLVYFGGRQWYNKPFLGRDSVSLSVSNTFAAPGNKVAIPGNNGALGSTAYTRGTSNATALVGRAAALCHESLMETVQQLSSHDFNDVYSAPLLKAMLTHGCSWSDISPRILTALNELGGVDQPVSWASRWIGYGIPDIMKVLECTPQRATVLGFGHLGDTQAHIYKMPLPPSLGSRQDWRRITVTLAWFSPTQPNTQKYRTASLWFEAPNSLASERQEAGGGRSGWQAVRRGTLQHEVFDGEQAYPFVDGDNLVIKVNCRKEAAEIDASIPYGIVVSLEVREGVELPIYEEIRDRVRVQPSISVPQRR